MTTEQATGEVFLAGRYSRVELLDLKHALEPYAATSRHLQIIARLVNQLLEYLPADDDQP